ncbi:receptor-type tyrosine-protein phosphatase F-like [Zophobas morio]|uniref:receptor-type tyrosine-protein phosphatase F-like n=1 Tax=Zophobas morio TaxID=2755281 RepID=UPI003083D2B0
MEYGNKCVCATRKRFEFFYIHNNTENLCVLVVIFAPGHLQVQLSQPNEMIISWKHPVYTNGKIKAFEIVVDDGEEETRFIEEISSENLSYNKTIRIEYEKRYNISVWGQNVGTRGRKATIYAIFSKPVPEFSTIPFLTTCGRTCSLVPPTAKSQKIKKITVIITKNNEDQVFCSENVTFCDTGLQMQDIWKQKYYLKIDNATFPIEFTAVDVDIKKTELFYVVIALCAVLMIIVGFPSYLVFKRRKQIFRKHSNTNSENTAMLEFEEKKNSAEYNNSLCRETKLSDFKNYFLASLDDSKIIQQFKVISKFRDRSCTREMENFDFENHSPRKEYNETTAMNNERRHLNANYINSYDMPKAFLVTEPPLESTLHDFWSVVCQENVKTIIMLTKLEENGCLKCEKYWPDEHSHFRFGKFLIRSVSVKVKSDYVQQILEVKYDNETRVVRHFQYMTWSNRNVPQSVTNFTSFVTELMEDRDQYPFVVHCDGKRGRTGIYILCEVALRMSIQEGKVDFLKTCKEINQPAGLISHLEQYIFCHFVML